MALLTTDMQGKLVTLLAEEGLVSREVLAAAGEESVATNKPLFALLTERRIIDDEMLTHALAQVSGVPYVNLTNSVIDQPVLELLP